MEQRPLVINPDGSLAQLQAGDTLITGVGLPSGYLAHVSGGGLYFGYAAYDGGGWRVLRNVSGALAYADVSQNNAISTLPTPENWAALSYIGY